MLMISNPKCKNCGHYPPQTGICLIDNRPKDILNCCNFYTESPYICELCNKHIVMENVYYASGQEVPWHLVCGDCLLAISTCNICKNINICPFAQDSSIKDPPYIMQTIRQGNAIMQTQVKNPKRIELTCKNCKCYNNETCLKEQNQQCNNFTNAIHGW